VFDNLIDMFFLVDMVLMGVTSYVDKFGTEMRDQGMILRNYIYSKRFLFDTLAVLGTGVIT